MYCAHCGAEVNDNMGFCPNCGFPLQTQEPKKETIEDMIQQAPVAPNYTPPVYQQPAAVEPVYQPEPVRQQPKLGQPASPAAMDAAKTVLVQGILSVAFACSFFLSFLGIIFGIIGRTRSNQFAAEYGDISVKARIGRWLSLGGLIGGIFMTICFAIYVVAIVAAVTLG